jgi:aminomethyltransferase
MLYNKVSVNLFHLGVITSGTVSPILKKPIAMGYVKPSLGAIGQKLSVRVRGKDITAVVTKLPFTPHHYKHIE